MEQFADIRVDRVNIQMEDTLVRNLRPWRVQELVSRLIFISSKAYSLK